MSLKQYHRQVPDFCYLVIHFSARFSLEAVLKPHLRPTNLSWKMSQNAHILHICLSD